MNQKENKKNDDNRTFLCINNSNKLVWYHKEMNIFDGLPVSKNELKNI